MEVSVATIFILVAITIVTVAWRILNWVWVRPKYLERRLREQGFAGNPYRIFFGDLKESSMMSKQANSKPINLSDDISPRVVPIVHHTLEKYGKNSFMWFGPRPRVFIMDPEQIKDILTKMGDFRKLRRNPLTKLLSLGVLTYEDEKWAKHRKIINPAFRMEKLKEMLHAFYQCCNDMISQWERLIGEEGSCELDVWPYIENLSGDVISIIDNLDNSVMEAVFRVRDLVGPELALNLEFHLGDLRNKEDLEKLFSQTQFDAVIHFAGLKAVGESVAHPRRYFDNNLVGTINLYEVMAKYNCKKMVFSSSATVYGQPEKIPCVEDFKLQAMNPYGRTKLFLEEIARDIHKAEPDWRIILLRYFNPVGAHESGRIGEDPKGIPNNLMPYIQQVAVGRLPELNVYGHDYPTKDGSAIRDYIHVMDLADGHLAALQKLFSTENIGCTAYNLGTGCGTSVLEIVAAFEKASGKKIPIKLCPRRPGDATAVYASTEKAKKELGWKAKYGIVEMCRDQWNWASYNPWGYHSKP